MEELCLLLPEKPRHFLVSIMLFKLRLVSALI